MKLTIPSFIRRDFLRKMMALLFAILLWFYVEGQLRQGETFQNIPVTLMYDKNSVSLEKELFTVSVSLRGSGRMLQKVRPSDLKVTAQMKSDAVPKGGGFYDLPLPPENVSAPVGVRVVQVDPPRLMIPVDRMETKRNVPVRVTFSGKLRPGYQSGKSSVSPAQIDIRGPGRMLTDLKELLTEPVPLDETLTQGFEMDVKLAPRTGILPNSETVHVVVEVSKQTILQTYQELPLYVLGGAGDPLTVTEVLPSVTVTLQGPHAVLESVDAFALRPFVDISTITKPGRYRRPVQLWGSGLATLIVESVTPSVVEVTVGKRAGE